MANALFGVLVLVVKNVAKLPVDRRSPKLYRHATINWNVVLGNKHRNDLNALIFQ